MPTAITRKVSPAMNRCELAYAPRQAIDTEKAAEQHRRYEDCLRAQGVQVISLPPEPDLPDAVFVEDPAVVVDEVAVIARMAAESRRGEAESVAAALARFRPLDRVEAPATLEGGDAMRVGSTIYVGASSRTNAEGIRQLRRYLEPFGYRVERVDVPGAMHLKTACCYLGRNTMLANGAWVDLAPLAGFRILPTPPDEPWAANVLVIGGAVILPAAFPATRRMLEREGWNVETLDISELTKAEAGLTCMSLVFETSGSTGTRRLS